MVKRTHLAALVVCAGLLIFAGKTEAACPGGNCTPADASALQTAITTTSVCGDTITLNPATTYTGNFTLTNKGCSGIYITITSSGTLPASGVRVLPTDTLQLGHLVTSNTTAVLSWDDNADYWQLIGIEMSSTAGSQVSPISTLVWGGFYTAASVDLPDHIILDRVYVHGSATNEIYVGLALNGSNITIKNSRCEEIHAKEFEAECIQMFNGPGPVTIDNNYLSANGEVVMFGGNAPIIHNMVLDGLTFTNNYLTKKCEWMLSAADVGCVYDGNGFYTHAKNTFEFKSVKNALVDHNIMENPLIGGGQTGEVVIMQSANPQFLGSAPDYNCPLCGISNITFTNNILRHGAQGVVVCGNCFLGSSPPDSAMTVTEVNNVVFSNNLIYDLHTVWGGAAVGQCAKFGADAVNISWHHNTCDNNDTSIEYPNAMFLFGTDSLGFDAKYYTTPGLSVKDSFMGGYTFGLYGNGTGEGTASLTAYVPAGYTFLNNVIASDVGGGPYPATTIRPSVATFRTQFVDRTSDSNHFDNAVDYRLIGGSVYKAAASDGTDIGVNMCLLPDPAGDGKASFSCGFRPRLRFRVR